ncbi:MAG: hypothetical protein ABS85_07115 [Sphingobacteriales bacterium SCN 48-20]|jgi:uncharacterized membrane protein YcaP (DUF421 family)|uniref:YetF domain-containing protein n=1 Tax=Terrimonas ferruginea TaxID=249 RepID=UPI0008686C38|nr:YetF domain-containing protein [Terrimonas ferruginea]MBN8782388.1 DUF421 domain-containing protein [Terrimonas ferruginea]ODT93032.1 MAG: hypothetical protein ABS85_07115 [Sphingobacteriales bacterium SCN 48-20]OJW42902.1 MAG: hypothetical protein BGO56_12790 [Sphingobacteriales bacterium 48-107]
MFSLLQAGSHQIFDWPKLLFGEQDSWFVLEILFRTVIMYIVILVGLRLVGKRGVRQLSVFELVVIIGLGSAAGDPMFYQEVGLVSALFVFLTIIMAYRATTWLTAKSKKFEELIEGKTICLIEDGKFCHKSFDKEDLAQDEFFAELRTRGVSQVGQVERGYLETSGEISLFFYPDDQVKSGLPILPHEFRQLLTTISEKANYACRNCGSTFTLDPSPVHVCTECGHDKWVRTSDRKRVN